MLNRKKKKIIAAVIAILLAAAMVLPLVISVSAAEVPPAGALTCMSGVTLDGTDVSGMTRDEVQSLVDETVNRMRNATITLKGRTEDQSVTVSAGNLGLRWTNEDIAKQLTEVGHGPNIIARYKEDKDIQENGADYHIGLEFDQDVVRTFLENNCLSWNQAAADATMTRVNGAFQYTDGEPGYVIDEDATADAIEDKLTKDWDGSDASIDLVFQEEEPKTTAAELQSMTSVLGTFTTYYSTSNAERKKNIANGCSLINGTTLQPGEEFSVLKAITPFTAENGYELAGSYLGDEVVESFGGGICQVSTTLYNAVIRAELKVTARSNHSLIVTYVDPSDDAAIAESAGMDMKFVNTLENPVYIEGYADGGAITFNIYGVETRDPGRKVSFESETLTTTPSEGVKVKEDASQPIGYVNVTPGHTGYTAQLWKVVTQDGAEVSRDVFNHSTYNMTPELVTVGTAGNMTEELKAAIESGNVDEIRTAAENAKNGTSDAGNEDVAKAAQDAAQEAYAQALAAGQDTNAAMEAAQAAANAVVNQAAADAGSSGNQDGTTEPEGAQDPAAPAEETQAADAGQASAETAPAQ